jgi:hypothetical protein
VVAGAARGKDRREPLDRLEQPLASLVQRILAGQVWEEVSELAPRSAQEAAVARDPHQHLRDAVRDDLRIGQLATGIPRTLREQIVRCAIDSDAEQVEVGVHRGLLVDGAVDTADFDLPHPVPIRHGYAVASII